MSAIAVRGARVFWPPKFDESASALTAGNVFRMNADGHTCALMIRAPKGGSVVGLGVNIAAVGNAPDNGMTFAWQGVSLTTGAPDGSDVTTVSSGAGEPSAAGWVDYDWGTPQTVTRGDLIALVVRWGGAFTALDSVTVGGSVMTAGSGNPYALLVSGSMSSTYLPMLFLRYSDGSYGMIDEHSWALSSLVYHDHIKTTSTPDEVGQSITLDTPCLVSGIFMQGACTGAGSDFELHLLNAGGGDVVPPLTFDGNVLPSVGSLYFSAPIPPTRLAAGVEYIVSVRPTTANASNVRLHYGIFPNVAAMRDTSFGGLAWYMVTRTDAGAWTRYNNATDGYRKVRMGLVVEGWDNGRTLPRTRPARSVSL